MSLLFCDGFEKMRSGELLHRWSNVINMNNGTVLSTSIVRSGTQSLKLRDTGATYISKAFPVKNAVILGVAEYRSGMIASAYGFQFHNQDGAQSTLTFNSDGSMTMKRGSESGTTISTSSSGLIQQDTWQYLEVKLTVGDSPNGSFYVELEGEPVYSGESIDTKYQSTSGVSMIQLYSMQGGYTYIDDVYICDTLGGVNDDFLGPQRVDTLLPSAAGSSSSWNSLSGENYANVFDQQLDSDATYVQTASGEVLDTYAFENLTTLTEDNIAGVQLFITGRRTAETAEKVKLVCRAGGANYSGEAKYLAQDYAGYSKVWDVDPSDSAQWTETDVNNAQFGMKKFED